MASNHGTRVSPWSRWRRATAPDEEERLKSVIFEYLGHPFTLGFTYVDEIPRSAGGKYEDFLSLVEQ